MSYIFKCFYYVCNEVVNAIWIHGITIWILTVGSALYDQTDVNALQTPHLKITIHTR